MAAQDLDDVLVLAAESVEAPHWTRRDYEQILLAAPSDPLLRCGLVALSDGNLAGFAVASWLRQEAAAEVEGLVVEPEYRRQGIGSALIDACMAWAANAGASTVRLEVRASNAAAHRSLSPPRLLHRGGPPCLLLGSRGRRAAAAGPLLPRPCTSIILQGFGRKHGS